MGCSIVFGAFGAEAGNKALGWNAAGGLYIAGGLAPKLKRWLSPGGPFLAAFADKGRFGALVSAVPVRLVAAEDVGRRGAHLVGFQDLFDMQARRPSSQFNVADPSLSLFSFLQSLPPQHAWHAIKRR